MRQIKYPDEYEKPPCLLSDTVCDKNCPYWDECPIEEYDRTHGDAFNKFLENVVRIVEDRRHEREGKRSKS